MYDKLYMEATEPTEEVGTLHLIPTSSRTVGKLGTALRLSFHTCSMGTVHMSMLSAGSKD